jgi:hypothetical protein
VVSVVELLVIAVVSSLEDSVVEGLIDVSVDEEVVEDVESVVLEELVGLFEVVGSVVEVVVVVPLVLPSEGPQPVIHAVTRKPRDVRIAATLHLAVEDINIAEISLDIVRGE